MKASLKLKIAGAAAALGLLYAGGQALAANITYSANTTVAFTSPAVNFTIVSGSVATEVIVNAGNIVVTIPTSSTFTLTSASRDVSYTGASSDSTRTLTCSGGTATFAITSGSSAGEAITISPATSQCGVNAGGGGGGGSSGGGGSPSPAPSPTPTPTPVSPTPTPASGGLQVPGSSAPSAGFSPLPPAFAASLKAGATKGNGIMSLQQFLNGKGFTIAKKGQGSPGKETKLLGSLTASALKKFQKSVKLKATGRLDKPTLNYLKSIGF